MKKEIAAGYLWQARWNGPGFPIYPSYWSNKPTKDSKRWEHQLYKEHQKEMEENLPEEILDIKPGEYTLLVGYPFSKDYELDIEVSKEGITRQELMDLSAEAYHQVYKYVDEGIYAEGIDEDDRDWNKYGIWGHSMEDLTIHTFYVDEEINVITLGVDS